MTNHPWQFSIRGLLLFTAAVAVVLAVLVKIPIAFCIAMFVAPFR